MKRLALHVLLSLLTFSAGVGIERLLIGTNRTQPATTQVEPVVYERLFTGNPVLAQPAGTPTPTPSPTSNLILDYDITKFDPYGEYTIIGDYPAAYYEFRGFSLNLYATEDGEATGDISVWTTTSESAIEEHKVFGLVTERRLILVTNPNEKNVVYRFEGEFLRRNVVADAPEGTAVVQGTLTKSKKGRKLSVSKVKFQIVVDHC